MELMVAINSHRSVFYLFFSPPRLILRNFDFCMRRSTDIIKLNEKSRNIIISHYKDMWIPTDQKKDAKLRGFKWFLRSKCDNNQPLSWQLIIEIDFCVQPEQKIVKIVPSRSYSTDVDLNVKINEFHMVFRCALEKKLHYFVCLSLYWFRHHRAGHRPANFFLLLFKSRKRWDLFIFNDAPKDGPQIRDRNEVDRPKIHTFKIAH